MQSSRPRLTTLANRVRNLDQYSAKPAVARTMPFYLTTEWRGLMTHLIRQRGRQCVRCGRTDGRIFGDHVVELKDGGAALDEANIQLLCGSCHTLKTAAARAARMAQKF